METNQEKTKRTRTPRKKSEPKNDNKQLLLTIARIGITLLAGSKVGDLLEIVEPLI